MTEPVQASRNLFKTGRKLFGNAKKATSQVREHVNGLICELEALREAVSPEKIQFGITQAREALRNVQVEKLDIPEALIELLDECMKAYENLISQCKLRIQKTKKSKKKACLRLLAAVATVVVAIMGVVLITLFIGMATGGADGFTAVFDSCSELISPLLDHAVSEFKPLKDLLKNIQNHNVLLNETTETASIIMDIKVEIQHLQARLQNLRKEVSLAQSLDYADNAFVEKTQKILDELHHLDEECVEFVKTTQNVCDSFKSRADFLVGMMKKKGKSA